MFLTFAKSVALKISKSLIEVININKLLFDEFLSFRLLINFSINIIELFVNIIEFRLFVENEFDLNKFNIFVQRLFCL